MTVLVTGASGFLGRALCGSLAASGVAVRGTCRPGGNPVTAPGVEARPLDLRADPDWDALLDGVRVVYHLAWTSTPSSSATDPAGDLVDNVAPTLRLLQAASRRPDLRLVFASSGGTVYGVARSQPVAEDHPTVPISAYGAAKLAVERYLGVYRTLHGLDAIALRIGNLYGSRQDPGKGLGAVTHFARAALAGRPIVMYGSGEVVRDYVHVDDVVRALLAAGAARGLGGEINIGCGTGRSLNDVVACLESILGRRLAVERRESRSFDVPVSVLDNARARALLGWTPRVGFSEGVSDLLATLSSGRQA